MRFPISSSAAKGSREADTASGLVIKKYPFVDKDGKVIKDGTVAIDVLVSEEIKQKS